jgi:hypothetical protein
MARVQSPESLARDMLKAAGEAGAVVKAVVKKGAQNIKTEGRKNVAASAPIHNAHAQYAITYDTKFQGTSFMAEIGYDKGLPGGDLGNLLEYGGKGDKSPPHRDLGRALDVETSRFEVALAEAVKRLL